MAEDKNVAPVSNKVVEALTVRRAIVLGGEINLELVGNVIAKLLQLQVDSADEPITLLIDSGGGRNDAAWKLCDFLSHLITAPVHAVVVGKCMSAATFVLLHCAKRAAFPHAEFLIHSPTVRGISLQVDGNSTAADLADLLREATEAREQMLNMYVSKLTIDKPAIEALIKRGDGKFGSEFYVAEALQIGLIEEVVTYKLGIFPGPQSAEGAGAVALA